jgi:acyl-CoA synthetase (AMP-forming)/AMP-acid ligase II
MSDGRSAAEAMRGGKESDFRLAELIREQSRERPDAAAVTGGGRTETYAELHERSSRFAAGLTADGVGESDRVVHLAKNSVEQIETLFGAAKVGAVSVLLNWRLTARELAGYKRPKRVEFAESLPRNPTGKVVKRDLRRTYAQEGD